MPMQMAGKSRSWLQAGWASIRFSSTVSSEKRRMFWKVRAMPARTRSWGLALEMSWPMKVIEPSSSMYMPVSRLKKVVLPAPLGPIRERISWPVWCRDT